MHHILDKIFIVIIVGSLIPVAISVSNNSNDVCFPIPSFMVPAYSDSWSYYFNTTNHRWYNASSTTNHSVAFDSYSVADDIFEEDYFGVGANSSWIQGQYIGGSNLSGQHLYEIDVMFSGHDQFMNDVSNDTIYVGVFNGTNGQPLSIFGIMYASSIPLDDMYHFYNFTYSNQAGFLLPDNSVIGTLVVMPTGNNAGRWIDYVSRFNPIEDSEFRQWNNWQNNTAIDSDNWHGFDQNEYMEILKNTTSSTTYTLIPLSGHSPVMTAEGMEQCEQQFNFISLLIVFVIIGILLYLIHHKRKQSK